MTDEDKINLAREFAGTGQGSNFDLDKTQTKLLGIAFLKWLNERYCVVERSKVVVEYQYSKESYERNKGEEDYFEGYWEGRVGSYEDIFGSETFNKKEE